MASRNISTKTTAERLAGLLNEYYAKKSDLTEITTDASNALKSATYVNNKLSLFRTADHSGTAAFEFDLPEELFLDQAHTAFIGSFTWSAAEYPGSTNPNLDGKPVMVLAIKGDATNPSFSFLNMETLVDTYSGAAGDGSTTVTVSGYTIGVVVNLSEDANNALTKDANGKLKVDISGKVDKLTADAQSEDNILVRSAGGGLKDGGKTIADLIDKPATATNGNLAKFDSNKNAVDTGIPAADVQQKLAAGGFTEDNVRVTDASGFAKDSGIAISDVLTTSDISDYTEAELRDLLGLPAAG